MIRIAIVDDEKEQVVMLSTCVSVFFQERNLEYRIFPFFCGEDLLSCNIPIDVAFLHIQMNGINGIETAQRLRAWNKWVALIYITSYDSYIQKAMTIHPFAYLTKPTEKVAIFQVLDEYLSFQRSITNAKCLIFIIFAMCRIARFGCKCEKNIISSKTVSQMYMVL